MRTSRDILKTFKIEELSGVINWPFFLTRLSFCCDLEQVEATLAMLFTVN